MSHWIYKEKKFLEIDGKILPLVLIADSSVTCWENPRKHPAHWWIQTFDEPSLLIEKSVYQEHGIKAVQERIDWLTKYEPEKEHSFDSWNPYGDTYRGNGRIRGMKSFYSVRNTILPEKFFSRYRFTINLEPTDKQVKGEFFAIQSIEDVLHADEWFRNFREQYPDMPCYISVRGLPGED